MKNRHITFTTILPVLGFLALSPIALAVVPAPDGGYPGNNTAEGQNALLSLTTGSFNTAVGSFSLKSDVTGGGNTAVGAATLLANIADQNTATGLAALLSNTTGDQNTANGALALLSNTIGSENTANGAFALFNNTFGNRNTANGHYALFHNTNANGNTANGAGALQGNTTGSGNTASGVDALAANTTGSINTANGAQALFFNTTGGANTAVGVNALSSNSVGANNTAIGTNALTHNTTGSNNIAIGVAAGTNITTASDTICIGIVGVDTTDGCYIGHVFEEALDPDHLAMAIDVNGKVGTPASSRRFKEDIKPIDKTSEAILGLKPVTFHYKNDKRHRPQFGLIAEEVAQVDPNLVALDKEGKPYSVRYDQVNAMLLNEFLKERKKVEHLEAALFQQRDDFHGVAARQRKEIAILTAQLKEQAMQIQKVSARLELSKPAPRTAVNDQ
jgi:Chaperone of endosialidase